MSESVHANAELTKNQTLVMGALTHAGEPLSAYKILDDLRDDGFRAPQQVYRALEKLVEYGLVHKLESLNAFLACNHPGCENHKTTAFMICEACGHVDEITDEGLRRSLKLLAQNAKFALRQSTIELRGTCHSCAAV